MSQFKTFALLLLLATPFLEATEARAGSLSPEATVVIRNSELGCGAREVSSPLKTAGDDGNIYEVAPGSVLRLVGVYKNTQSGSKETKFLAAVQNTRASEDNALVWLSGSQWAETGKDFPRSFYSKSELNVMEQQALESDRHLGPEFLHDENLRVGGEIKTAEAETHAHETFCRTLKSTLDTGLALVGSPNLGASSLDAGNRQDVLCIPRQPSCVTNNRGGNPISGKGGGQSGAGDTSL